MASASWWACVVPPAALAGGGGGNYTGPCHDPGSFLGVANAACIGKNGKTASALVALIVVLSLGFEFATHKITHSTSCPQVQAIFAQLFAEIMILGFISMGFFVMQVNGLTSIIAGWDDLLNAVELWHFMEFFHYAVFITMLYYIAFNMFLLWLSTRLPRIFRGVERKERARETSESAKYAKLAGVSVHRVHETGGRVSLSSSTGVPNLSRAGMRSTNASMASPRRAPTGGGNESAGASLVGADSVASDSLKFGEDSATGNSLKFGDDLNTAELLKFGDDIPTGDSLKFGEGDDHTGEFTSSMHALPAQSKRTIREKYMAIKQQRREQGLRLKLRPSHLMEWWKAVLRMGYVLARERCKPLYGNREVMQMLFGLSMHDSTVEVDFRTFSRYSTRSLLVYLVQIHWSTWTVLLVLAGANVIGSGVLGKKDFDSGGGDTPSGNTTALVEFGFGCFLWSIILLAKSFNVLMGIINTSVSRREKEKGKSSARSFFKKGGSKKAKGEREHSGSSASAAAPPGPPPVNPTTKAGLAEQKTGIDAALEVFAGAKAHLQRFWFKRPSFMLRMLQTLVFTQAIYMSLVTLMFLKDGARTWGGFGLVMILLWPFLIIAVVVPLTMPTLVIAFNMIGYVGGVKLDKIKAHQEHHQHDEGVALRPIEVCPMCGARELVLVRGVLKCAACGVEGLPQSMKVKGEHEHGDGHHRDHSGLFARVGHFVHKAKSKARHTRGKSSASGGSQALRGAAHKVAASAKAAGSATPDSP
eukprot:g6566.t1